MTENAPTADRLEPLVIWNYAMRCELNLGVSGCDGAASLTRYIEIPFVPNVGLQLQGITNRDGNLTCAVVESVEWDVATGELSVHLVNDHVSEGRNDKTTLAEVLADWGEGWEVSR